MNGIWISDYINLVGAVEKVATIQGSRWQVYKFDRRDVWKTLRDRYAARNDDTVEFANVTTVIELHALVRRHSASDKVRSTFGRFLPTLKRK